MGFSFSNFTIFPKRSLGIVLLAVMFPVISGCVRSFYESGSTTSDTEWVAYLTENDDGMASIATDLALYNHAPIKGKDLLISIELEMLAPRPDGLSSSKEAERLNEIDEKISGMLQRKHGAVYTGRLNHAGKLTLYFYTSGDKGIRRAIELEMTAYHEYQFRVEIMDEPGWETYLRELYPKPEQQQSIKNGMVIDQLIEAGDTLERKRKVEHWAYFPNGHLRKRFIDWITPKGFHIKSFETTGETDHNFCVRFSREDYVDHESVDGYTRELWRYAAELGGKYGGWETLVLNDNYSEEAKSHKTGTRR